MMKPYALVELDVRPMLKQKLEPFERIMKTVKALKKNEVLLLHATFKPTPLLGVMRMKGYRNLVRKEAADHWKTYFFRKEYAAYFTEDGVQEYGDVRDDAERSTAETALPETTEPTVIRLDNRGLTPPQPMVRTLSALEKAKPGDRVEIHNDRVPVFLIEELRSLGCPFEIDEQPDGSAIVTITRANSMPKDRPSAADSIENM